jgi:predicted O-methyltransferase YrrM
MNSSAISGPVYEVAASVLTAYEEFRRFRAGELSRAQYCAFLDSVTMVLTAAGLPPEDVDFAKRYPVSEVALVNDALSDLVHRGIVASATYDADFYDDICATSRDKFNHGNFRTYIYPEEARLLFAIADVVRPRAAVFLGSYYGYWAHAATAAIARHGGRVVLVDPDERVQAVARLNLATSPYRDAVELQTMTGEQYLSNTNVEFDFVVLDAEGPRTHPEPEQRGKRVYSSLLRHCLPKMSSRAILVCHNILFHDHSDAKFFYQVIARNQDELGAFMKIVSQEFDFQEYASTEGVGIGRRKLKLEL